MKGAATGLPAPCIARSWISESTTERNDKLEAPHSFPPPPFSRRHRPDCISVRRKTVNGWEAGAVRIKPLCPNLKLVSFLV